MAENIICKCPRCGGDIRETEKAYGCSNWKTADGGCKMTVWKIFGGRDVSAVMAKEIIENGITSDYYDGFIGRASGTIYSAKLAWSDNENRVIPEFKPKT